VGCQKEASTFRFGHRNITNISRTEFVDAAGIGGEETPDNPLLEINWRVRVTRVGAGCMTLSTRARLRASMVLVGRPVTPPIIWLDEARGGPG
jgi:hypothetical protein